MKHAVLILSLAATLAACEATVTTTDGRTLNRNVPEEVLALAGPGQDLSTAVMMEDGCFWYRHVGPVETTMLPLRAVDGRPICAALEQPAEA